MKTPYNNSSSTFAVCISSNWLYDANAYHFLNPVEDSYPNNDAYHIFTLFSDGSIGSIPSSTPLSVKPVVYLKPTVKIVSGIGTKENPFVIRN